MNAIRHLLKDHEEIGKLFNQFVEADEEDYEEKETIVNDVIEKITSHAEKEEKFLFPAFKEKGGKEAEEMALYGDEEHEVTKFMMKRLGDTDPENEAFTPRFHVLMEYVKHHFGDEEHEIFPKVKEVLDGDLELLGQKMTSFEKQAEK